MIADVWHVELDADTEPPSSLRSVLSADEAARASRFKRPRDRHRYVAIRAALRRILSTYTGEDPGKLVFRYSEQGKPSLVGDRPFAPDLHFNVSHSEGVGLVAVSPAEIGVDLERVRPLPDLGGIAVRVLAPDEAAALAAVPARRRVSAFFDLWVRKEALLKATGEGLSGLPERVTVVGRADRGGTGSATIVRRNGHDWLIKLLVPGGGFRGAVAMRLLGGPRPRVRHRRWGA